MGESINPFHSRVLYFNTAMWAGRGSEIRVPWKFGLAADVEGCHGCGCMFCVNWMGGYISGVSDGWVGGWVCVDWFVVWMEETEEGQCWVEDVVMECQLAGRIDDVRVLYMWGAPEISLSG